MSLPFFGLTLPKGNPFATFTLGALYTATESGAATSVILNVKRNGTWEITFGGGDAGAGTPLTGNWSASPFSTVGDAFEVKYTPSNQVNAPVITNGAAAYTTINASIQIEVNKTGADASADILVEIREISTPVPMLSKSTSFEANGEP